MPILGVVVGQESWIVNQNESLAVSTKAEIGVISTFKFSLVNADLQINYAQVDEASILLETKSEKPVVVHHRDQELFIGYEYEGLDNLTGRTKDLRAREEIKLILTLPTGTKISGTSICGVINLSECQNAELRTISAAINLASPSGRIEVSSINGPINVELQEAKTANLNLKTISSLIFLQAKPEVSIDLKAKTITGKIVVDGQALGSGKKHHSDAQALVFANAASISGRVVLTHNG